jgi:ankyrin repeat protein
MELLREHGADFDAVARSSTEMRPVHWAAAEGKTASLMAMKNYGINLNSQDSSGCTPLIIAAQHEQIHTVIFLVKNGADTRIVDNNGDTALHWAAYKGNLEVVGLLTYLMRDQLESQDKFGQVSLQSEFILKICLFMMCRMHCT